MDGQSNALAKAWEMFDTGNYLAAETLYLQCLDLISSSDTGSLAIVLNGLIYTEAFLKKYDEAQKYGSMLLDQARNVDERHIAVHQLGMVARMAGNYEKAIALFSEEEALIHSAFPDDPLRISANLYEQGYVALKLTQYDKAEKSMLMSLDCAIKAKDHVCMGCAYRGMGEIMTAIGQAEKAFDYFENAIAAFTSAEDWIAVDEILAIIKK